MTDVQYDPDPSEPTQDVAVEVHWIRNGVSRFTIRDLYGTDIGDRHDATQVDLNDPNRVLVWIANVMNDPLSALEVGDQLRSEEAPITVVSVTAESIPPQEHDHG